MPPNRKYTRPAITEAVLDIQLETKREPTLKELDRLWNKIKDRYSQKQHRFAGQFEFGLGVDRGGGPKTSVSSAAKQIGYAFKANDDWIFQATVRSFTVNRLGQYPGWERILAEAQELWPKYSKEVKVKQITRVALRYINQFDIPAPRVELKDFFRTNPEVSSDLPQVLDGFFMQSQIALPDVEARVVITLTMAPPMKPDHTSLVLDIDLFRTENLGQSDEQMWAVVQTLREKKNFVFEACITDRVRELIL